MLDPNSTIPAAHEVRVTMRGVRLSEHGTPVQVSTRSDFIAPDIAPVPLLARELEKGKRGWTAHDVKPVDRRSPGIIANSTARQALIDGRAQALLDDASCGTTVLRNTRKAPAMRRLNNDGPAHRRTF